MATREQLLQEARDAKNQSKIDAAYEAALTSTETAPKPALKSGKDTIKVSDESPYGGERLLRPKEQLKDELDRMTGKAKMYDKQAADAKANRKEAEKEGQKYAKGGVTRADGCISKGHTRGKMV